MTNMKLEMIQDKYVVVRNENDDIFEHDVSFIDFNISMFAVSFFSKYFTLKRIFDLILHQQRPKL